MTEPSSRAQPDPLPQPRLGSHSSKAFWAMVRRVTLIAGAIDLGYLCLFLWLGSPLLAWINVVSMGMYAAAYGLIGRRHNAAGLLLIWAEVIIHSAAGSLLIGWDSGFHYYLLLFIPAIVIANTRGYAIPLVTGLLAYYLGLWAACNHFGALAPLPGDGLRIVFWIHVCLVFAMFASISAFYRRAIVLAEQRLFRQATSDGLTGLFNRSHFQAQAAIEMARSRRTGDPVALVLCDIDHFKQVNDRHGHEAGDRVLQHVARILRDNLREADVLARWGGEEFLALMPACPPETAHAVAERIRQALEGSPVVLPQQTVYVTLSLGVTPVRGTDDIEAATARADQALYESKHAGRNRVSLSWGRDAGGGVEQPA